LKKWRFGEANVQTGVRFVRVPSRGARNARQPQRESTTPPFCVRAVDTSTAGGGDTRGNGEAQPGAGDSCLAGRPRTKERLEYVGLVFGRDAAPLIFDFHEHFGVALA